MVRTLVVCLFGCRIGGEKGEKGRQGIKKGKGRQKGKGKEREMKKKKSTWAVQIDTVDM